MIAFPRDQKISRFAELEMYNKFILKYLRSILAEDSLFLLIDLI